MTYILYFCVDTDVDGNIVILNGDLLGSYNLK